MIFVKNDDGTALQSSLGFFKISIHQIPELTSLNLALVPLLGTIFLSPNDEGNNTHNMTFVFTF